MLMSQLLRSIILVVLGAVIGGLVVSRWDARLAPSTTVAGQGAASVPGVASGAEGSLEADVAALKDARPSQSHAMMDVGYQFANLWFAAEKKHWPLARFYFNETRSHIRWTIRLRPIRKHPDGSPVDLKAIWDAIESSSMETLKQTIEAKDSTRFVSAYKLMMESCYACHKANGFDYLRLQMPTQPPQTVINYDPNATWPQ